ncbi:MAG: hypothetical protein ACRC1P_00320 [Cellulosilyticaceae bacterium]
MSYDVQKLKEAREMINHLIQGVDINGEVLEESSFLCTPKVMRQLALISQVLTSQVQYTSNRRRQGPRNMFNITIEELAQVKLPDYSIGVNEFAKHINEAINSQTVKGISGAHISSRLKAVGILGQKIDESGKKLTVINKQSKEYGIEVIPGEFNGRKYEKIVFNEKGKQYLLEHFIEIMELYEASATVQE